jgi:hypothetical protein
MRSRSPICVVRRLPALLITLPAWFGAIGFTAWGLVYYVIQVQIALGWVPSTSQYVVQNANPNAVWGYYWYALFILWGYRSGSPHTTTISRERQWTGINRAVGPFS